MQQEITTPSKLLDERGQLIQRGWARQPYLDCNLENVSFYAIKPLQFLRVKRWDYYSVFTPTTFFSATVAHIGYLGDVFVYVLDFESEWLHEETLLLPLGGGITLPRNSTEGDVVFDNGKVQIEFRLGEGTRRVVVNWPGWNQGQGVTADFVLRVPAGNESMVTVLPFSKGRFFYTCKMNCLPAEGWLRYGEREVAIEPSQAVGGMDWGRGVWDYKSFWNWASTSAYLPDGRLFGLNLGAGVGDIRYATDNGFWVDGRIHKLDQVDIRYNPSDFMQPWKFVSPDGRLDLDFVPFKERVAKTDMLVLASEVHQMFGRYSGRLVADDGEIITIKDVIGFAEEHRARW